jgi:F-type H+-transporting ATPase subunit delta
MASKKGNQEIARRYATALFELARHEHQLDVVARDLQNLAAIIENSDDFRKFTTDGGIKRLDGIKAVQAVSGAAGYSPTLNSFLGLLAQQRRLGVLPAIITAVQAMIDAERGEVTAEITSAMPLEKGQVDAVAANLKKALGANIRVKLINDPAIMGGLIIKVGSRLIDNSVRTKLDRLARALQSPEINDAQSKIKEVA